MRAIQGRNGNQIEDGKTQVDENERLEHIVENEVGIDSIGQVVIRHGDLYHFKAAEHPEDHHADDGNQDIGGRSCQRSQRHAAPHADLPVEPACIHRNGLCPAEAGQQQAYGAHRVKMGQGIEGHAALDACGVISQLECRPGVSTLVDGCYHQNDNQTGEKIQKGGKIQIQDCVLSFCL